MISLKKEIRSGIWLKNKLTGKIVKVLESVGGEVWRVEYSKGYAHKYSIYFLEKHFELCVTPNRERQVLLCKKCNKEEVVKGGLCLNCWSIENADIIYAKGEEQKMGRKEETEAIALALDATKLRGADPIAVIERVLSRGKLKHLPSFKDTSYYGLASIILELKADVREPTWDLFCSMVKERVPMYRENPRNILKLGKLPWAVPFTVPSPAPKKGRVKTARVKSGKDSAFSAIHKKKQKLLDQIKKLEKKEEYQKERLQALAIDLIRAVRMVGFDGWISKPAYGLVVKVKSEKSTLD